MPVYNGEQYLREAMDSILNQTFRNFEFLIIDDGSIDHSLEILKSYDDTRIKIEENGKNLGLIATLNKGLRMARGEYVARMDCDDISLPDRLEKQVEFMEVHPEIGVCGTWFKSFTDSWNAIVTHPTTSEIIKSKLFFDNFLGHPTVLMRMSAIEKYGLCYDPAHLYAEDYGLWVTCSFLFPLANLPEVLLHHRDIPSSITQSNRLRQIATVMEININNLARLGISEVDKEILALHQQIVFNSHNFTNWDSVMKANAWLLKIQAANALTQCYPEPYFSFVLAEKWNEISNWARHATDWGKIAYLQSPLSFQHLNPSHIIPSFQPSKKGVYKGGKDFPEYTIDVVIPAYNCEAFIAQTLLSVIKQTYLPQQIIVVDDGSTDKTGMIVQELAQGKDSPVPIQYIRQDNRGLSAARNTGIRASRSQYIAFLDADDLWEERKLKEQVAVFQSSGYEKLGVVYCDYSNIDRAGVLIQFPCLILDPSVRGYVLERLLSGNFIASSGSGVLVRRECFDKVGMFDEDLPNCEDWDMWIRIAEVYDFDFAHQKLVRIRRHNTNMSNDTVGMLIGKILVLNKIIASREIPPWILQNVRKELNLCKNLSHNKEEVIDFGRYMTNLLKEQIYK